jgi:uncharacterized protein DUF87
MILGQISDDGKLECDLPALVDTRLLIQANSGGGKSWLLRLIAERAGIQTIVLDSEGEFASLREAVDMLLVGADGELPANPRHAALLARRLIEYKVSAVIDLYELKLAERRQFVKLFLDSLIHLPRELWQKLAFYWRFCVAQLLCKSSYFRGDFCHCHERDYRHSLCVGVDGAFCEARCIYEPLAV